MKPNTTSRNITTGVVLAGGRSSRMGFPKTFLTVNGKRMIDIILEVFHSLFEEIFIITDNKNQFARLENSLTGFVEFKDIVVIEDLVKGCGPLGGVYTGLKSISKDAAFFIACDMPLVRSELIKRLLKPSMDDYDCIVPYTTKGIEPLHAVYTKRVLPIIEDLLKARDISLNQLLKRCRCKYIKVNNQDTSSFFNVNTPEELGKLQP